MGFSGKEVKAVLPDSLSSLACQKEETRKGHPSQSWPCGLPLLLAAGGTRKNSGFALKQFPRLFPPPSARRGRTNGGGENPTGTPPSTGEAAEKGFALFERSEFAKPRQHRGAQGIPPSAGQGTRGPFLWFVSLGKQRNEQKGNRSWRGCFSRYRRRFRRPLPVKTTTN